MVTSSRPAVAIMGAGPFGLSIAAHLRSAGVDFRIFGTPMERWRVQMPQGMFLKSEGCASNLSEPTGHHTLARYCAAAGLPYGDQGVPPAIENFTQYALDFQRRLVPSVEDVRVTMLDRRADRFELRLDTGETVTTDRVVMATGLAHTAYKPAALAGLPSDAVSHSEDHHDLSRFKGHSVTVVGRGQSALETAALLHEAGATVSLVVRRPAVIWLAPPPSARRSLYARMRHPMSNLGPGLGAWFYSNAPMVFYRLPQSLRHARVREALGPAGACWLKDRVVGRVQLLLGHTLQGATSRGGRIQLQLRNGDGAPVELMVDHVVSATGYRFDLTQLPFLAPRLTPQLRHVGQTPLLSSNFESSVPGLYFTGLAAANHFGPAMRFLHGVSYAAHRISGHIAAAYRPSTTAVMAPPRVSGALE